MAAVIPRHPPFFQVFLKNRELRVWPMACRPRRRGAREWLAYRRLTRVFGAACGKLTVICNFL